MLKKRILKDFIIYGFATYGILWTIAESFGAFFDHLKPDGIFWYIGMVSISVLVGIMRSWPRNSIEFNVPNSDSKIEIIFGDIFSNSEAVVIPVNEYFDSLLGNHVSEKSLHGKFIKNILGGQSKIFNQLTDKTLKTLTSTSEHRTSGRKNKYPIGSTAIVDMNGVRYFLTALSRTDTDTLKASATVHELWDALAGMWNAILNHSNGATVKIPLLGSGLSGVGLPASNLIEIILISYFYYTKQRKIANKVILVLSEDLKYDIDLLTIKKRWI